MFEYFDNKEEHTANHKLILSHIEKYGVRDKDATRSMRKKRTGKKKLRQRRSTDLHGLTSEQAEIKLRRVMDECRAAGIRELLIIHGKGYHSCLNTGPVLKGVVRDMLGSEFHSFVSGYGSALPRDGGDGATLVHLKY
ncbi:Smr/MutS family protein [Chitinispirillales bacterium ANBcel5]|uniref:Smr/MutS family protein n=1 Tax=Cellulosispirillum alkaliphilum TaxID=3039283 RepID=UPI002A50B8FA|nr:Smr/MutS family protein [Chitinispirillales bacterium ANBcel5]